MTDLSVSLLSKKVNQNELAICFLGQAGFVFKTESGKLTLLDPYLSNCCERYFGFKRLMPYVLNAGDIVFDTLITSHAHYDHFDPDSVPSLLSNGHTELIGAKDIINECERLGIKDKITTLSVGDEISREDFTLKAVKCDHGELATDALGLLFNFNKIKVYFMGDTAYRPEYLDDSELQNVDLLILPINGAFGNLNSEEASYVCNKLKPKLAIPCHYWNFAEHGGNPFEFAEKMKENAPDVRYSILRQGEIITIK